MKNVILLFTLQPFIVSNVCSVQRFCHQHSPLIFFYKVLFLVWMPAKFLFGPSFLYTVIFRKFWGPAETEFSSHTAPGWLWNVSLFQKYNFPWPEPSLKFLGVLLFGFSHTCIYKRSDHPRCILTAKCEHVPRDHNLNFEYQAGNRPGKRLIQRLWGANGSSCAFSGCLLRALGSLVSLLLFQQFTSSVFHPQTQQLARGSPKVLLMQKQSALQQSHLHFEFSAFVLL